MLVRGFEQRATGAGVVAVVFQRIRNRLGHDRVRREMHDGVDLVLREYPVEQGGITSVADDEFAGRDRLPEARAKVVKRDDVLASRPELPYHVAADITGAAGYQ